MRTISLMYHDVVARGSDDASGFPGSDAALYKLDRDQFALHLAAIRGAVRSPLSSVLAPQTQDSASPPVFITFDDGGVSAHSCIADMLEEFGWKGHFFVTAGRVGSPGFVTADHVRDLHRRGHVIGSHSWSHPLRMSHCAPDDLALEWRRSVDALSDMLGERVSTASVPGGYYSSKVAEAAGNAGIEVLFTSEPTSRSRRVQRCLVLGRYTIQRWTSPRAAAAIAAGRAVPRLRQLLLWNAKKLSKRIGGEYYLKVRETILRAEPPSVVGKR